MSLFHRHKWKESERLYAPPATTFAFGVTTIVLKCEECGDLKTIQAVGKSSEGVR